mgnify:CR=1 FL=1
MSKMTNMPIKTFLTEGFWMHSIKTGIEGSKALEGDHAFDAVIVGGGFTGLSSAIALAERGYSVAIVEKGLVSAGASGFNSGQVGIQLGMNPRFTLKYLGLERTKQYAATLVQAITNVTTMVERSGHDCNYRANGNLTTGVHESQRRIVEDTFQACTEAGLPVKMLTALELEDMGIPPFVKNAFHELIGGTIQPAKYAYALASIATSLGVTVFENSPITKITPGHKVCVESAKGSVKASMCVLATNGYTAELGFLKSAYIPYSVSVLVTERLTPKQRARLDWRNEEGLHTPHKMIENIRLTPDGRILIGTKRAQLGYGTRHPNPQNPQVFQALTQVLRDRFPELPDISPEYGWTGRIAIASDTIPFFTKVKSQENIVFGGGYGGHGIAMASYAGNTLARMLCDEDTSDMSVFIDRKRPPLPPEPLRWLIGHSLAAGLKAGDNKIDSLARMEIIS